MTDLAAVRQRYAEELRRAAGLWSNALVRAFATVPREHFLGPGPWEIFAPESAPRPYRPTLDDDPVQLYRDVLVGIDPDRLLNNGQPSAQATWIDQLDLQPGERVVHIGSGTGYYSAILAEGCTAAASVCLRLRSIDRAARLPRPALVS